MSAAELTMRQLYRAILKAAKQFPSIKKHSIIQQVKTEFRENAVRQEMLCLRAGPAAVCACPHRPVTRWY
jgi:TPP-dependent indolepyruvate ferredoxin oxidoreductase alpha subunit